MNSTTLLTTPRKELDEHATRCASVEALSAQVRGAHFFEVQPEGHQDLAPAFWLGSAFSEQFHSRTRRQPSVRIYKLCDEPWAFGTTALVNDGCFQDLDYLSFCETSRFHEFSNVNLVEAFLPDTVTFRMPGNQLRVDGECALVTQRGDQFWGHWLVDVLPRIKVMREALPGITIAVSDALGSAKELLGQAGVATDNILFFDPFKTRLSADSLYVPSFVRFANGFSPIAGRLFKSLSSHEKRPQRKLYVTRSQTKLGSTLLNHEMVESLFAANGFEIVAPETLSVEAQLRLFGEASHVAGEYGSGLHNAIFAAEGTPVMCLQSENVKQYVQAGIGAALQQPTGFVFGQCRPEMQQRANMAPSYRDRCSLLEMDVAAEGLSRFLRL